MRTKNKTVSHSAIFEWVEFDEQEDRIIAVTQPDPPRKSAAHTKKIGACDPKNRNGSENNLKSFLLLSALD